MRKMEKDHKKLIFSATPIIFFFLLILPSLFVAVYFVWGNTINSLHPWTQYFSSEDLSRRSAYKTVKDMEYFKFHLARLVRGEDRRKLDATGFACDKSEHSIHCVSTKAVRIDPTTMTVHIPYGAARTHETSIRPYARQEDKLNQITPVRIIQYSNTTSPSPPPPPPRCQVHHGVPAVVFSSGSTGNVFHEMNEIIIPLYITTKHFQSRVVFFLEDYKPSFVTKYAAVLSRLSSHQIINAAATNSIHCFPASIVGLKYHNNLALNSSDIPGGYGMPEFRRFIRDAFRLRAARVDATAAGAPGQPRLLLLSRTNNRRFLNEEELISLMKEVGFDVMVVRGSKMASNLNKMSQLVNSCGVLVGAHGAGLTNEIFLPAGGVMIQVELLGMEWASKTYYGDTARGMDVHYLPYKINVDESSLAKIYGWNRSVVTEPASVYREKGYIVGRRVFLDQQNVKVDLARFRETLVQALSIVTDWPVG